MLERTQRLISATFILTMLSSLLFVAGFTYNSTYLQAFGIAPDIFQYD
ncbi:MAG: hypothetical protein PF692_10225 [Kiritimatiellae bacterium]|nr:hypothetical protein [Kiritimatiellia bacterium]